MLVLIFLTFFFFVINGESFPVNNNVLPKNTCAERCLLNSTYVIEHYLKTPNQVLSRVSKEKIWGEKTWTDVIKDVKTKGQSCRDLVYESFTTLFNFENTGCGQEKSSRNFHKSKGMIKEECYDGTPTSDYDTVISELRAFNTGMRSGVPCNLCSKENCPIFPEVNFNIGTPLGVFLHLGYQNIGARTFFVPNGPMNFIENRTENLMEFFLPGEHKSVTVLQMNQLLNAKWKIWDHSVTIMNSHGNISDLGPFNHDLNKNMYSDYCELIYANSQEKCEERNIDNRCYLGNIHDLCRTIKFRNNVYNDINNNYQIDDLEFKSLSIHSCFSKNCVSAKEFYGYPRSCIGCRSTPQEIATLIKKEEPTHEEKPTEEEEPTHEEKPTGEEEPTHEEKPTEEEEHSITPEGIPLRACIIGTHPFDCRDDITEWMCRYVYGVWEEGDCMEIFLFRDSIDMSE